MAKGRSTRSVGLPDSRLLTPPEAADYCRLSRPLFDRTCRVRPIGFNGGRVLRYDRLDLDKWIEDLKTGRPETDDEILARLG